CRDTRSRPDALPLLGPYAAAHEATAPACRPAPTAGPGVGPDDVAHEATAPDDAAHEAASPEAPAPAPALPASCVEDGAPYAIDALKQRVAFLASPELAGRAPGTPGDAAARAAIAARFDCLGLTPGAAGNRYEQPFGDTANVIGYLHGRDPEIGGDIILVGAHHDHLGDGHLGANDNASGVAALLAIAQAVRQAGPPRRTIAFVAFGAEERGLVGAEYFAANPPPTLPLTQVVQYINLDMVGSHASRRVVHAFGTFPGLPATRRLAALDDRYPKLRVGLGGHSVRGDQVPFCTRGIPYVFFWTPDARCYHATCDTAARLDYPRMADIAALAGALVHGLSEAPEDLRAVRARRGCGARR
ncbi:MAG: M28 family metallopeptidase, partial [Kofleriaceae bacterium]